MRDQLTCGSCYAFAGTSMIAARARVKSNALNDVNLMLSPQARAHTAADALDGDHALTADVRPRASRLAPHRRSFRARATRRAATAASRSSSPSLRRTLGWRPTR
eukprot:5938184-Prymnesium_polylepis.1